jgi:hypothetical protein
MESAGGETVLVTGTDVLVRLVKHPRADVEYPAVVLSDDGDHVTVCAPWSGPDVRDFGYVRFEKGDVFTEHFWRSRWFSVKEVRTGAGELKGWYCDVARPVLVERDAGADRGADRGAHRGVIVAADLDLDLWLSADRSVMLRLDEDEFVESGLEEREPETAAAARRALEELELLAADGFEKLLG